ncbi:MAG: hypothetical protein PHT54_02175 [Candidatus Nanoarchaeia archaeon]|nr:hypothetical protein [Candidatus Nanoarchaeia archaeon]
MNGWSDPYYGANFENIFKDAKKTVSKAGAINVAIAYGPTSYGGADCTEIQGDSTMSGTCSFRMVVAPSECTEEGREASVNVPIRNSKGQIQRTISIRHLDGYADDSFNVYLEDGDKSWLIGTYEDSLNTETWVTSNFVLPITTSENCMDDGGNYLMGDINCEASYAYKYLSLKNAPKAKIVIEATGDFWGGCGTYGQLAISSIALN